MNQKCLKTIDVVNPQECFNNRQKEGASKGSGGGLIAALLLSFTALVILQS